LPGISLLINNKNTVAAIGAIKMMYNEICFVGHIPALQAEMEIKFRRLHAMLKAEIKNAVLKLHNLLSNKSIIIITDNTICNKPGFPKLIASAFIPVTIIFCDSIVTQGI
jgi:hypothetical protein